MSDLIERVDKALDALRHLSYAEEQLEHAIRRAEDEGEEVPVLQGDKDLGSAPVERDEKVLPGVRKLPLERRECNDEMGGDFKMESAKELHIEALVEEELDRILKEHGLFDEEHTAYGVLKEEIEEAEDELKMIQYAFERKTGQEKPRRCDLGDDFKSFWDRVRDDDKDTLDAMDYMEAHGLKLIEEAKQIVAVCRKYKVGHLKQWVESKAVKV